MFDSSSENCAKGLRDLKVDVGEYTVQIDFRAEKNILDRKTMLRAQ